MNIEVKITHTKHPMEYYAHFREAQREKYEKLFASLAEELKGYTITATIDGISPDIDFSIAPDLEDQDLRRRLLTILQTPKVLN